VQLLSDNKWIPNAQAFDLEPEEIYRRPMTQAEKDAEAGKARHESDLVAKVSALVDGYETLEEDREAATRIIAMVREHDAKQIGGANG
jgi:hypothetical protein